jgi:hypothetical protein
MMRMRIIRMMKVIINEDEDDDYGDDEDDNEDVGDDDNDTDNKLHHFS